MVRILHVYLSTTTLLINHCMNNEATINDYGDTVDFKNRLKESQLYFLFYFIILLFIGGKGFLTLHVGHYQSFIMLLGVILECRMPFETKCSTRKKRFSYNTTRYAFEFVHIRVHVHNFASKIYFTRKKSTQNPDKL